MTIKTNSGSAKTVYLLGALFLVALIVIVLALWDTPGGKKGRPYTIKSDKPFYDPSRLPPRTSSHEAALAGVTRNLKGPIQGKVGNIDWCSKTVFIDDDPFNTGSLDLPGKIDTGDLVELMYEETTQGKVIASIHVLSKKNSGPARITSRKPFYDPARLPPRTPTNEAALTGDSEDIKGPVQGKVTNIDWCSGTVFIDDVAFNMGSLDLTGIETGDSVKLTYQDTRQGKVLRSIY